MTKDDDLLLSNQPFSMHLRNCYVKSRETTGAPIVADSFRDFVTPPEALEIDVTIRWNGRVTKYGMMATHFEVENLQSYPLSLCGNEEFGRPVEYQAPAPKLDKIIDTVKERVEGFVLK